MAIEEKEEKAAEVEAKPKGKKKLIIIVVAALVLVGGGAGVFLMKGGKAPDAEHEEEVHEEHKHLELADLGTFVVNLSESSSFVKLTMKIEYDPAILDKVSGGSEGGGGGHGGGPSGGGGDAGGGLHPAIAKREPMVRDAIIRVLGSKHVDELLTTDGKERVKDELVEAINEAIGLEDSAVTAIYFVEFIIQ